MDRIEKLCSYLDKCEVFADVGCDHGYCTEYMLKAGLCERAIISDISAKSLAKAEKLLKPYIEKNIVTPVVCNGLSKVHGADEVLIAGMGGEEILSVLKGGYIPEKFVFQPMKNGDKLRKYLLDEGCTLIKDDIFTDGKKFYFVIKGVRRGEAAEPYTECELLFGRHSLTNPVMHEFIISEVEKYDKMLAENRISDGAHGKIIDFYRTVMRELK